MKYTVYLCLFMIVGSLILTSLAFHFNLTPIALLILFALALGAGWLAGGIRQMIEQREYLQKTLDQLNNKKNG